jgi:hypothetical protein
LFDLDTAHAHCCIRIETVHFILQLVSHSKKKIEIYAEGAVKFPKEEPEELSGT